MIFIKDKKAWKNELKWAEANDINIPGDPPKEYPFYITKSVEDWSNQIERYDYIYRSDIQSMIDKIDGK